MSTRISYDWLGCCEYHGEKDKNGRQEDSWGKLVLGE